MKTFVIFAGAGFIWAGAAWAVWRLLFYRRSELDLDYQEIEPPVRTLEGRIVLCANCDEKTTVYTSSSGSVVCGVCGSPSWMFQVPVRSLGQVVRPDDEVRQLTHWYKLMPNDLPIEQRERWVEDAKRRAEARVGKANRQDAETA